ncbi:MAG TPA: hypothetical protein VGL53_18790 [Bryobacteraceae bacterium]
MDIAGRRRLRLKTWIFTVLVIVANAFGNLFLDKGVHGAAGGIGLVRLPLFDIEVNLLWLVPGIGLLILWMLTRMALLGWADLTYVLPVTALGYVLSTVLAAMFLGERVDGRRWAGTILIVLGTALVSATSPKGNAR